jgi:hypothetical protein
MHLFEPARNVCTIPPKMRQRLLPLIIALLSEAAGADEPTAEVEARNE